MIVLFTFSITKLLLGILSLSLAVLLIVIAYKKLLAYLGKTDLITEDYCILYSLEQQPSSGEIELYFTTNSQRVCKMSILNNDMSLHTVIFDEQVKEGGNIVRFNTKIVENGFYFYQLETENQKTMKKIEIRN
jgi:hypothetical protein